MSLTSGNGREMELCPSPIDDVDREDDSGSELCTHWPVSDHLKSSLRWIPNHSTREDANALTMNVIKQVLR